MAFIEKKFIDVNAVGGAQFRLENNTMFRARNNANSADLNLFSVNTSDIFVLQRNLDANGFKLANATINFVSLASDPGSGVTGDVYYNTTLGALKYYNGTVWASIGGGAGTVTSVAATVPAFMSVTGSPITSAGTLVFSFSSQTANQFLASPSGGSGSPTMRSIVAADIPTLNQNTTGTAANITSSTNSTLTTLSSLSLPGSQVTGNISGSAFNVTGTVAIANGGTGQTTASAAFDALDPMTTAGDMIYEDATPTAVRLPIGTTGQILTVAGGLPTWATASTTSSSGVAGSVQFAGAGGAFNSDGAVFFWDNTAKRLNIGTNAGIDPLTVNITTGGRAAQFDSSISGDNYITSRAGSVRTVLGVTRNSYGFVGTETTSDLHIRTDNTDRITISSAGAIQFNTGYGVGVITSDASGNLTSVAATPTSLSSLTAATVGHSINNANFAQVWSWDSLTSQTAMTLSSSSVTTGSLLNVTSSNVANTGTTVSINNASTSGATGLKVNMSGASGANTALLVTTNNQNNNASLTVGSPAAAIIHASGAEIAIDLDLTGSFPDFPMYIQARQGTNSPWELVLNPKGGKVGIGNLAPASLFSVGSTSQFQVDSSGNVVKLNNITYSWPSSQGAASTFLQNNGSGTLTWVTATSGVTTVAAIDTSPNANGLFISGTNISTQTATATVPGMVSTGLQTFAGNKYFLVDANDVIRLENDANAAFISFYYLGALKAQWIGYDHAAGKIAMFNATSAKQLRLNDDGTAGYNGGTFTFTNAAAAASLILNGSTSGTFTQVTSATTTSYSVTWPNAQATGTQFLQNNGSGVLSWASASVALNSITAATAAQPGIDNLNFTQVWNWSTLASGNALTLSANSASFSGHTLEVDSTGATNSAQTLKVLNAGNGNAQGVNITMSASTGAQSCMSANNASASSNVTNLDLGLNAGGAAGTNARFNHGGTSGTNLELNSSNTSFTGTSFRSIHLGTAGWAADLNSTGSGTRSVLRLQNSVTAAVNSAPQMMFSANRTTGGLTEIAGISGMITDIGNTTYKGSLLFYTSTTNTAPTEKMRLDDQGRLGIGTSSPNFLVDFGNWTPGTTPNTINDKYAIALGFNAGSATPRVASIGIAGPNPNFSHPAYGAGTNAQAARINVNDTSMCFTTKNTAGDGQIDFYTFDSSGNTRSRLMIATDGTMTFDKYQSAGVALFSAAGVMSSLAPGTSGNVLTSNGATWVSQVAFQNKKELFTLPASPTFVDLTHVARLDSVQFVIKSGNVQIEGAAHDYTVSYTGGAGGNTRINFTASLQTLLAPGGNVIEIQYEY